MKITGHVYYKQYDFDDEGKIVISEFEEKYLSDGVYCFLKTVELDIDVQEPTRAQMAIKKVTVLESERKAILAETHQKIAKIDDKIRQLSAITYQGGKA